MLVGCTCLLVVFVVYSPFNSLSHKETGPWFKVSTERLDKPGIEPQTSSLHLVCG